jgi:hypothetical protein
LTKIWGRRHDIQLLRHAQQTTAAGCRGGGPESGADVKKNLRRHAHAQHGFHHLIVNISDSDGDIDR